MNKRLRDVLLFVGGFAGMVHQSAVVRSPQPVLVGAFMAMMLGAPALAQLLDLWDKKR